MDLVREDVYNPRILKQQIRRRLTVSNGYHLGIHAQETLNPKQ
jgi:hypothetical protein